MVLLAVVSAGCLPAEEQTFLDRTNALRASVGVRQLQDHDTLTAKAEAWANYMAITGRLEHSDLAANLPGVNWKALGENVAWSSPTSNTLLTIHNSFVSSPSHKKNLLDSRFTHMGVGVATDGSGRVWVAEVFAQL
ncbi:MAG: CAP domain-containing protein [Acidimicrobiales bacterium]